MRSGWARGEHETLFILERCGEDPHLYIEGPVSSGEEEENVLVDLSDAVGSRISCGQQLLI